MHFSGLSDRKRLLSLILIMVGVAATTMSISMWVLYNAAFEEQRARLIEVARSEARLIESIAQFNADRDPGDPRGMSAALGQVTQAHANYKGFGETGEFTLGKREGDKIVFLLNHRHFDFNRPKPVPFDSHRAEPIRRALQGQSGSVIGPDYRGETVLAAYEPVKFLNLGIAAKIDLSEIRWPFIRGGLVSGPAHSS